MTSARRRIVVAACAIALLLTACEVEDELVIHADGSGTYQMKVTVEKLAGSIINRVRAAAEQEGFRTVAMGETMDRRFVILRKEFTDIRSLSGAQRNFDLQIRERSWFWREYRLYVSVGSVAGDAFERRFTIAMPAEVKSTTAGGHEGRRVTWYCANGGAIEVVAAGFHLPFREEHVVAVSGVLIVGLALLARRRRSRATLATTSCTTCAAALPPHASFCPSCGDLAPASTERR